MTTEYRLIIERDAPFQTEQIDLGGHDPGYIQRLADTWEGKTSWGNGRGRVERREVSEWQKVEPSGSLADVVTPIHAEEAGWLPSPSRFFRSAAFPIFVVVVLAFIAQRLIGG